MRVKWYAGKDYFFEIKSVPTPEGFVFSIKAVNRISWKESQINDLGIVMSAFGLDEDDPRAEEKDWLFSANEITDFEIMAGEIFRNKHILRKIESELDEDRRASEWANTHPIRKQILENATRWES